MSGETGKAPDGAPRRGVPARFHALQTPMSDPGRHRGLFDALPADLGGLVRAVQGLTIHDFLTSDYGVDPPAKLRAAKHIRPMERRLDAVLALDPQPLASERRPSRRVVGTCRDYSVLLAAMLRHRGTAARARVGFATYFAPELSVDHWVTEHWDATAKRWVLVDAELDDVQCARRRLDFDPVDVPRDRFLIAGAVWKACRAGRADADRFGLDSMRGLWFVAGNVVRDAASLAGVEMLPWDCWGAMQRPDEPASAEWLAFHDRLADLTVAADESLGTLRELARSDARLAVPPAVFNALLGREETV